MNAQVPISVRYILPAWVIGISVTLVLLMMLGAGVTSRLLFALLRPGLILAELMGYGVHDWRAYILMVFVHSIFYGAIVFVIMLAVRKR
jgi:hypothetical protein